MAEKSRAAIQADINSKLADNENGDITPLKHREIETDVNDSMYNKVDDKALVGLRVYNPARSYELGEACAYNDGAGTKVYIANKNTTGTFIPADWDVTEGAVNEVPNDGGSYLRTFGSWFNVSDLLTVKIINQKSDLPAPVAGAIQLEDGFEYRFQGVTDLGIDKIVCGKGNTLISNLDITNGVTGSAPVLIEVPNSENTLVQGLFISGDGSNIGVKTVGDNTFKADFCTFLNLGVGIEDNDGQNSIIENNAFIDCVDGYKLGGTTANYTSINQNLFTNYTGRAINLPTGTIISALSVSNNIFTGATGSFAISGTASGGNISKRARVLVNSFNGLGNGLEGITSESNNWELIYNDGKICNTSDIGLIYNNTSQTVTIPAVNTWVQIQGVWTLDPNSDNFNNSVLSYELEATTSYCFKGEAKFSVTGQKVGGGGVVNMEVAVFEDGVLIPSSVTTLSVDDQIDSTFTGYGLVQIENAKKYSLYVRNTTDGDDFVFKNGSLQAKRNS